MISTVVLLNILIVFVMITITQGFANYLTHHYCDAPIENSEIMMSQNLMLSFVRNVTLFRADKALDTNIVSSLEGLKIALVPKSPQSVLEIRTEGVEFVGGSCTNKNRILRTGELVIPNPASVTFPLEISIVAAWAKSYEGGVKYTEPFVIIYDPTSDSASSEL